MSQVLPVCRVDRPVDNQLSYPPAYLRFAGGQVGPNYIYFLAIAFRNHSLGKLLFFLLPLYQDTLQHGSNSKAGIL